VSLTEADTGMPRGYAAKPRHCVSVTLLGHQRVQTPDEESPADKFAHTTLPWIPRNGHPAEMVQPNRCGCCQLLGSKNRITRTLRPVRFASSVKYGTCRGVKLSVRSFVSQKNQSDRSGR